MNDAPQQLSQLIGTRVLASVATLSEQTVLQGQIVPERMSLRTHFPHQSFYGETKMNSGLLGHAHLHGELAVVTQGHLNVGIGDHLYEARQGDWLVFPPDVLHGECCLASRRPYELMWFIFQGCQNRRLHLTRYHRQKGYQVVTYIQLDALSDAVSEHPRILMQNPWKDLAQIRIHLVREVAELLDQLSKATDSPPRGTSGSMDGSISGDTSGGTSGGGRIRGGIPW